MKVGKWGEVLGARSNGGGLGRFVVETRGGGGALY